MVGGCDGVLDYHYPAQVLEEVRRESYAVISYEFLLSTTIEHRGVHEVLRKLSR